jgi:hypothetical protein
MISGLLDRSSDYPKLAGQLRFESGLRSPNLTLTFFCSFVKTTLRRLSGTISLCAHLHFRPSTPETYSCAKVSLHVYIVQIDSCMNLRCIVKTTFALRPMAVEIAAMPLEVRVVMGPAIQPSFTPEIQSSNCIRSLSSCTSADSCKLSAK